MHRSSSDARTVARYEGHTCYITMPRSARLMECHILQPDHVLYSFNVPENCKGQECLDKICDTLGIVEKDYFGLLYQDFASGCSIWLNTRLMVKGQLKTRPPYKLVLAVKYFVEPELLLQTSTMEFFCKDIKFQIKEEAILVPEAKKGTIGACLAQVEFGDQRLNSDGIPVIDYPAYFPHWQGTLHAVVTEHQKLRGTSRTDAMRQLLQCAFSLDTCGVSWATGQVDGNPGFVAIGSHSIQIYDVNKVCLYKFPYYMLTQVSYGSVFFAFNYQSVDPNGYRLEKKLRVFVASRKLAQHMFRTVTEKQTFFVLPTVSQQIRKHAKERSTVARRICEKVFRMKFETKFYYDVVRTKMEAYSLAWQLLHEVNQDEMDNAVGPTQRIIIEGNEQQDNSTTNAEDAVSSRREYFIPEGAITVVYPAESGTATEEVITVLGTSPSHKEEEEQRQKSQVCWGLSGSCCNLAKLLLTDSQLRLTDAERAPLAASAETPKREEWKAKGVEPLTCRQGEVTRRLLMKVQEGNVCRVCMDELINAVFCPCGHRISCYGCAKRVVRCPLCRAPVGYIQYIHGSKC